MLSELNFISLAAFSFKLYPICCKKLLFHERSLIANFNNPQTNFFCLQNSSLHIYTILIPKNIKGNLNYIGSFFLNQKVRRIIQKKIIYLISILLNFNIILFCSFCQFDGLILCQILFLLLFLLLFAFGCFVGGFCMCGMEQKEGEQEEQYDMIHRYYYFLNYDYKFQLIVEVCKDDIESHCLIYERIITIFRLIHTLIHLSYHMVVSNSN